MFGKDLGGPDFRSFLGYSLRGTEDDEASKLLDRATVGCGLVEACVEFIFNKKPGVDICRSSMWQGIRYCCGDIGAGY